MRWGVRMPATTSSPCAFGRNSPYSPRSPLPGLREKSTPVPLSSPRLPNTIAMMMHAVPMSWEIPWNSRYVMARGLFQELNTASTAALSSTQGSSESGSPVVSWMIPLNSPMSSCSASGSSS